MFKYRSLSINGSCHYICSLDDPMSGSIMHTDDLINWGRYIVMRSIQDGLMFPGDYVFRVEESSCDIKPSMMCKRDYIVDRQDVKLIKEVIVRYD